MSKYDLSPEEIAALPKVVHEDVRRLYRLTTRGVATTLDIDFEAGRDKNAPNKPSHRRTIWSDASGQECTFEDLTSETMVHINEWPADHQGLLAEYRMVYQFCLGAGFGSRIRSIESVKPNGEFVDVDATIQLWTEDVTRAKLKIDRDMLVRFAVLRADVHGHETRFEISSEISSKVRRARRSPPVGGSNALPWPLP